MNGMQKSVACIGLLVLAAMVLYPPWSYSAWGVGRRTGPPPPPNTVTIPEVKVTRTRYAPIYAPPNLWEARVNKQRLLIQCAAVITATAWCVYRKSSQA